MPKGNEKTELRPLESVNVMGFELLNDDKVQRALVATGENGSKEVLLAEYDKLGGGIKKEGRKVAMGSFYDFTNKCPRTKVNYDDLEYEEEFVLVRKSLETKSSKGLSTKERVAKLGRAGKAETESPESPKVVGVKKTASKKK